MKVILSRRKTIPRNGSELTRNIGGGRDSFVRLKAEEKVSVREREGFSAGAASLPPSLPPFMVWSGPTVQLFITGLGTVVVCHLTLVVFVQTFD